MKARSIGILMAFWAALGAWTTARAADQLTVEQIGHWPGSGTGYARDLTVQDGRAYVCMDTGGLAILDVSNSSTPSLLGTYSTGGKVNAVKLLGTVACLLDETIGLQVLDVSQPAAPLRLGGIDTEDGAFALEVKAGYAWVGYGNYVQAGVQVFDLSDPATPVLAGAYVSTNASVSDSVGLAMAGNHAFVTTWRSFEVVDLSNPATPAVASTNAVSWSAVYGAAGFGERVVLATGGTGLQVYDMSQPAAPAAVGAFDTVGQAWGLALDGTLAYVADYNEGLQIIDLSDPAAPVHVGEYDTPGLARAVAVADGNIFVADGTNGLVVLRAHKTEPQPPLAISQQPQSQNVHGGHNALLTVTCWGTPPFGFQWLKNGQPLNDLDRISGSQTAQLTISNVQAADQAGYSVIVTNQLGAVTSRVADVRVLLPPAIQVQPTDVGCLVSNDVSFNVTASGGPGLRYQWRFGGEDLPNATRNTLSLTNVREEQSGDYSVVVSNNNGATTSRVARLTVRPPLPVALAGEWSRPDITSVYDVKVQDQHAYLACGPAGMAILDLANPAMPTQVGTWTNASVKTTVTSLTVQGALACLVNRQQIQVLDLTDPTAPVTGGNYAVGTLDAMGLTDRRLYATYRGTVGLKLDGVDLSNPAKPVSLGSCLTSNSVRSLALSGTHAILAAGSSGLQIVDVSDPKAMTTVGNLKYVGFDARWVALAGTVAYVSGTSSGLFTVDVTDPTAPATLGSRPLSGTPTGMAVEGDYLTLAFGSGGIRVYDVSYPATPIQVGEFDTAGTAVAITMAGRYVYVADGDKLLVLRLGEESQPPKLSVTFEAGQLRVAWPATAAGYTLMSSAALPATEWSPVTIQPVDADGQRAVTIPIEDTARFYRLQR
jgi:hypothetical protein